MRPSGKVSTSAVAIAILLPTLLGATCSKRIAVDQYPPGTLRLRFVQAANYTDCLVSCAVMSANYVLDSQRFSPSKVRADLAAAGYDHTRIADLRDWLKSQNVSMIPLKGELSGVPRVGIGWWLLERGYPVTCVVNKCAGNADYNHAVVVVGIEASDAAAPYEAVYVLDPASPKRLERWDRVTFEHYWGSAGRIILPIFEMPRGSTAPQE